MKWTWPLPAEPARTLALDYNYLTGTKRLTVDGEVVPTQSRMFGWSHTFPVGVQQATVTMKLKYLAVAEAELQIDGKTVAPLEAPRALPPWTWIFVLANMAILVASRGGAIPGAIAGVGAVGTIAAARSNLAFAARLALSVVVTGLAWGAFYALVPSLA
jgi:hypothetical protein